ncbi:MAG: hypothetical protein NUW02_00115 [Candidatus Campbellbacteria bacterium]|nr:hypothetical protein [Candidatus Campbellbacteria bacterium]
MKQYLPSTGISNGMKKLLFIVAFLIISVPSVVSAATWTKTAIDSTGNVGSYTSTILGLDGFARVAYYDVTNANLKFIQCTNIDCTTNVVTTIDSTGDVGQFTSIAISSDGFARISYYDITNSALKFVQCTNDACSTSVITTIDSVGIVGKYTSLAILDSDGFARISYYDTTNKDLKFVQCTNAACSTSVITTVDSADMVGENTSLVLGSDGFARITYNDASNAALKFVQCTNAACSASVITYPDPTGDVGLVVSSLALTAGDLGRISYYGSAGTLLFFIQCTNASCSTKTNTTIDATETGIGIFNSIALGTDGFARIAYYDDTNDDLKFAQCTNATCSTKTITVIDSTGDVGAYLSIVLDADGSAYISYFDTTNSDLKFAYGTFPPELTVTKTVVNDHGGTAVVGDFPLFVDGVSITSGVATTTLVAGTYTITETEDATYTAGDWGGDCAADGTITLALGDTATCTITNDDIAPTLTVTTTVTNDDQGTATISDFTLNLDGLTITSGTATTTVAASHTLTHSTPAGYTYTSTWGGDCATDGTITMSAGGTYTCTLTNDDDSTSAGGGSGGGARISTPSTPPPISPTPQPLTFDEQTKLIAELRTELVSLMRQLLLILLEQLAGM